MDGFARCAFSFVAGALFDLATTGIPWLNAEFAAPLTYPAPWPLATPMASLPTRTPPTPTAFAPIAVSPVVWRWYSPEGCVPALRLSPLCDRPTPNAYQTDHVGR